MKNDRLILAFFAFLAINNIVLFAVFALFFGKENKLPAVTTGLAQVQPLLDKSLVLDPKVKRAVENLEAQSAAAELTQAEVKKIIQAYIVSHEFIKDFERAQTKIAQQSQDAFTVISQMDATDLYHIALNASSEEERVFALNQLLNNNINDFEPEELKKLYPVVGDQWRQSEIVAKLIEHDDPDALPMAKDLLQETSKASHHLYASLYENDAEFMKGYISQLDIEDIADSHGFYLFMHDEPELYNRFVAEKFDDILDSNNEQVFELNTTSSKLDIDYRQQESLADLFGSDNKTKRQYAISMSNNIDDVNLLRAAFGRLERQKEQQAFLNLLSVNQDDPEKKKLLQELQSSI